LIVVAVGLIACAAAALLRTSKPLGSTGIDWGPQRAIAASKPAAVPGGGTMRIGGGQLRATAPNASDYALYRVSATLEVSRGAAIDNGRAHCVVRTPPQTLAAKTPNGRAALPQPSNELSDQPVPRVLRVEFNAQGAELAIVNLGDAFGRFASRPGVKVEWDKYRPAQQGWNWALPGNLPAKPLTLSFASVWRTAGTPAARIACTVTTSAGIATAKTAGAL
jgi:hypothetical protein